MRMRMENSNSHDRISSDLDHLSRIQISADDSGIGVESRKTKVLQEKSCHTFLKFHQDFRRDRMIVSGVRHPVVAEPSSQRRHRVPYHPDGHWTLSSLPISRHKHSVPNTLQHKIQVIRAHPSFQQYRKQFERLLCPITLQIMHDPVMAGDGHTYQRQAITQWFKKSHTSPLTKKYIGNTIQPNHLVRGIINDKVQQIYHKLSQQPTPSGQQQQQQFRYF